MWTNYFKTAWRNIRKHSFYSVVNIVGLFTGILFTLLIGAYVWGELRVNKNLRNAKSQYFLRSEWKEPIGPDITTLGPLAKRLKESYPSLVANYYRWDGITSVVSKGDKHFREGIQLGDSTLLSMYGFDLLHGDARTALNNPFSAIITRGLAKKYFGKENVVGETLSIQSFSGENREFAITGVLDDIAENSVTELNPDNRNAIFIPTNTYSYFGRLDFDDWLNIYIPSYIELKEGVSPEDLAVPIEKLVADNAPDFVKKNLTVKPVALSDYHLQKNNALVKRMLYALSFVALFILLMAVVNFINLSIGGSATRIKEIGIRKVMGSLRAELVIQFLLEAVLLVFAATALAIAIYPTVSPLFSQLVDKEIPSLGSFPVYFVCIPALLILIVGLLAGFYPALVLSSMKSVDSLKGKLKSVGEKIWLRKSLVGFQFSIAVLVMVAAVVVSQQINHFFGKQLGYNKEYIVSSQVPRDWTREGTRKMLRIRDEFARMPQVENVTLSYEIPNGMNGFDPQLYKAGGDSTMAITAKQLVTDAYYPQTYQIPVKAGSFFKDSEADSFKVVINESAVKSLGWKDNTEAIGQRIKMPGNQAEFVVQGVISDFHFGSMQQKISPIIFLQATFINNYRFLSFKLKPGNIQNSIEAIQRKWSELLPGTSFEYSFMDQSLAQVYATEIQLKKAALAATGLSLVIVLLGVLGMVSLSIQRRVKEIGIRKVVGASLIDIHFLFVKEFLAVILLAGLVACPLAYVIMKQWLQNYTYRISIGPSPFLLTITILCTVTLLLVVIRATKAAMSNPVKSLRSE